MSAKCPKCGSAAISSDYTRAFHCGTLSDRRGTLYHTTTCHYFSEFRKPLDAYIKRLEEAGDKMADWNMHERNLGCDPELSHKWQQAKEAKP